MESITVLSRFLQDAMLNNETDVHHDDDDDKPWGDVILGSILVQLVTFAGLLLIAFTGCYSRMHKKNSSDQTIYTTLHQMVIPSFGAGALLATTVFLLIPEGLELIGGGHSEEEHHDEEGRRFLEEGEEDGSAAWKFGAALLGGFIFPLLLHALFPTADLSQECPECELAEGDPSASAAREMGALQEEDEEDEEKPQLDQSNSVVATLDEGCDVGECEHHHSHDHNIEEGQIVTSKTETMTSSTSKRQQTINWPLACSILVGDGFHNFTDGIFIGNAFLLCSRDLAFTLVATTIYHELAQELADYALLTHHCGLSPTRALLLNFVSGFSTMIGAVIILGIDMSQVATGVILSISAGVYIYIAASECIPRIQAARQGFRDTILFLLCFVVGAVPIGLVLLNHGHCEAAHHDDHDPEELAER